MSCAKPKTKSIASIQQKNTPTTTMVTILLLIIPGDQIWCIQKMLD